MLRMRLGIPQQEWGIEGRLGMEPDNFAQGLDSIIDPTFSGSAQTLNTLPGIAKSLPNLTLLQMPDPSSMQAAMGQSPHHKVEARITHCCLIQMLAPFRVGQS